MLYQVITTKVIKYSSVANKSAPHLLIFGIEIHEFTFIKHNTTVSKNAGW